MGRDEPAAPVVLLVDDEPGIRSALRRALRREGYRLLTAEDARVALRILEETPVDVIVSDQKMPGLSGLELFARARALAHPAARILLTGWPEEVAPGRQKDLGIRAVLPKPWDDARLKQTLREALPGATRPAAPRAPSEAGSGTRDRSSGYSSHRW